MAQIWDYIAQYNPTGFYEDNRSKTLANDLTNIKISAANRENARQQKIMDLQDAWNNGDTEALRSLGIYAPEIKKQYIDNEQEMLDTTRPYAQAILQMAPEKREEGYQQMRRALKNIDFSDAPANYDETFITTLANSDPTKIQQERQAEIARQAQQDMLNRQISLVNYQRSMANQDTADRVRKIQEAMASGRISPEQGQAALNELELGIKPIAPTTPNMMKSLLDISKMQISPEEKSRIAQMAGLGEIDFSKPIPELEAAAAIKEQYPELTDEQALSIAFRNKGTTVNVNSAAENEFDKGMGKNFADLYQKNTEAINSAYNQMVMLEQMQKAISDDGLYQGTAGEAINNMRTMLASLGYDVKSLDNAAILKTGSSMLMGNLRKDLMPGPLSDRDLKFLIEMTPSLTKTRGQNNAIVNMYMKAWQRKMDFMKLQNDYLEEHKNLSGFEKVARERGFFKDAFTKEEKAFAGGKTDYRQTPVTNQFSNASDDEILGVLGGY